MPPPIFQCLENFRRRDSSLWKFALLVLSATSLSAVADDRQIWLQQGVTTRLSEKWSGHASQEFRLADDVSEVGSYFIEAAVAHETRSHLVLGGGFRAQFTRREDDWLNESRPFLSATLRWSWRAFKLSDRNQFEFRSIEDRPDEFRYRNRIMIESPNRWTLGRYHPYAASEFFFDDQSDQLLKHRFVTGLKGHPKNWLQADGFVMWESTDTGVSDRSTLVVVGLKLTATL